MLFRGLLATDLSGSVAGITASHNRGGAYFRNRTVPTNPNTPFQSAIRAIVSQLASAWTQDLSVAQRDAWDVYAANTPVTNALGAVIFVSGLNMYIRSNTPRLQVEVARIDTAPTTFGVATYTAPTIASITAPSAISLNFTAADEWAATDDGLMLIYASRPVNQSINFFKGPFRLAGAIIGNSATPPTSPASIPASFVYTAGQKVFLRVNASAPDGRLGTALILTDTVV